MAWIGFEVRARIEQQCHARVGGNGISGRNPLTKTWPCTIPTCKNLKATSPGIEHCTPLVVCERSSQCATAALVRRRKWGGGEERGIPEKTLWPTASSGTIPTCENPVTRPGIEPRSPWWEASMLIAQPPGVADEKRGHGGVAVRLLVSRQGELGILEGSLPDLCTREPCRRNAASRRVFSGISSFPRPCIPAPFQAHLTSPSSALKTSMLRAVQISPPQWKYCNPPPPLLLEELGIGLRAHAFRSLDLTAVYAFGKDARYLIVQTVSSAGGKHLIIVDGAGVKRLGKREITEKTRRPTASSGSILTCENPVIRPGIEPGSPWWEASVLITEPPWLPLTSRAALTGASVVYYMYFRVSPDFRTWESCRTMPLVGGFSRGSPVSPALSVQRCCILTLITLMGSQDHDVTSRPNLFTIISHGLRLWCLREYVEFPSYPEPRWWSGQTTRLPPKANRVRFPLGSLAVFRTWELCRTMPLVAGFSRGSSVPPDLAARRFSVLAFLRPHRL
ncbi:hypothetical protein PR048_019095 [Dryococelus australis]|uniref:Uncharacterized protein n=1 Tax=Dryococelus australis TaxID=614101 RepID=A0ABQ9H2M9_9NEOP|nr:hypothetical protein PR048_019095 [Dryococelus australis]